jgi:hypothetical protein
MVIFIKKFNLVSKWHVLVKFWLNFFKFGLMSSHGRQNKAGFNFFFFISWNYVYLSTLVKFHQKIIWFKPIMESSCWILITAQCAQNWLLLISIQNYWKSIISPQIFIKGHFYTFKKIRDTYLAKLVICWLSTLK